MSPCCPRPRRLRLVTLAALAALALAPATAAAEARGDTDVLHYDLSLEILPNSSSGTIQSVRITGRTDIEFASNVNGLATFTIDLRNELNILSVTGNVAGWSRASHRITVTLAQPLAAGQVSQVSVRYQGYPPDPSAFNWFLRNGQLVLATFSQVNRASTWWACKNVVDDKATIDVDVTVPGGLVAISNGVEVGEESRSGGRKRFLWSETRPIAPYLVSLAVSDYRRYDLAWEYEGENGVETLPVPCWTYPDHWDPVAKAPLPPQKAGCDELPEMLETFSDVFGLYPFVGEKYGVVETGDPVESQQSMENQTVSSMRQLADFTRTMAHELAHQWWGDEITVSTWNHAWLHEGFATYSEAIFEERRPGGSMDAYWEAQHANRPTNPDAQTFRPDGTPMLDNDAVYKKGAWVLHMLRGVLGDAAFFRALGDYRAARRYGSASTADFAAEVSASVGRDLGWFIDQWVMQPGSPDYVWSWQAETGTLGPLLKVRVRQTQEAEGFGVFTMPLDLRLTIPKGTDVRRIWNDASDETWVLRVPQLPTRVTLDEDGAPTRNWVLHGSKVETSAPVAGPPVLLAAAIAAAPGAEGRVTLWLSEDVGGLDPADVRLTGPAGPVAPLATTWNPVRRVGTVRFPPLAAGAWVFELLADGVHANAQALDGELDVDAWWGDSLFPSGDGRPGGDAAIAFAVGGDQCADGVDNDGDGRSDGSDAGCTSAADPSELDAGVACDDGIDNDGDGRLDYDPLTLADPSSLAGRGDPGCNGPWTGSETPACQDGIDDDGDGRADFDGGQSIHGACRDGVCPPGVTDVDGDGVADPDPQCVGNPTRTLERASSTCGTVPPPAVVLTALLARGLRRRRVA